MIAETLLGEHSALWSALMSHPFVVEAGDGTLPAETFDRWLVQDHCYVVEFRRFLAALGAVAPTESAREVLFGGLTALQAELNLFRGEALRRRLDLHDEPSPTTLGYSAYLHACAADGYAVGLTALYAAEKAYFDAWSTVRARAENDSAYWPFIDNWSSPAFGEWVDQVGVLLDDTPGGERQRRVLRRVVRFERRFWDAVYVGEGW